MVSVLKWKTFISYFPKVNEGMETEIKKCETDRLLMSYWGYYCCSGTFAHSSWTRYSYCSTVRGSDSPLHDVPHMFSRRQMWTAGRTVKHTHSLCLQSPCSISCCSMCTLRPGIVLLSWFDDSIHISKVASHHSEGADPPPYHQRDWLLHPLLWRIFFVFGTENLMSIFPQRSHTFNSGFYLWPLCTEPLSGVP